MLITSAEELRLWLVHFKIPKGRVIDHFKHGGCVRQNQCMCKSERLHCSQNATFQNVTNDKDFCRYYAIDLKLLK